MFIFPFYSFFFFFLLLLFKHASARHWAYFHIDSVRLLLVYTDDRYWRKPVVMLLLWPGSSQREAVFLMGGHIILKTIAIRGRPFLKGWADPWNGDDLSTDTRFININIFFFFFFFWILFDLKFFYLRSSMVLLFCHLCDLKVGILHLWTGLSKALLTSHLVLTDPPFPQTLHLFYRMVF